MKVCADSNLFRFKVRAAAAAAEVQSAKLQRKKQQLQTRLFSVLQHDDVPVYCFPLLIILFQTQYKHQKQQHVMDV